MTNTVKLMDKVTKGNVEVSIHEHDSKLSKYPHYKVTCAVAGKLQDVFGGSWSIDQARDDMYKILNQFTK